MPRVKDNPEQAKRIPKPKPDNQLISFWAHCYVKQEPDFQLSDIEKRNEGTNSSMLENLQVPKPLRVSNPPRFLTASGSIPAPAYHPSFPRRLALLLPRLPTNHVARSGTPTLPTTHTVTPCDPTVQGPGRLNSRMKCRLNRTVERGSGQQATVLGTGAKITNACTWDWDHGDFFAQLGVM
jgi:hypothetical protein